MPEITDYTGWIEAYTPEQKERVYALMRSWGMKSDRADEQHRKLRAPYGTLAVGSADMDPFFRYIAISEFLTEIRRKRSVKDAGALAKESLKLAISKWNSKGSKTRVAVSGSYELERWTETEFDTIETMQREFWNLQMDIELNS